MRGQNYMGAELYGGHSVGGGTTCWFALPFGPSRDTESRGLGWKRLAEGRQWPQADRR